MDLEETFAHVAQLESIRIVLSIACHLKFKLYQMDVEQPEGFVDPQLKNHVYKLK